VRLVRPPRAMRYPNPIHPRDARQCPWCKSTDVGREPSQRVGQYRAVCLRCGRVLGLLPMPWDRERALRFRMPFGQFAGRELGDLLNDPRGRDYLAWAAHNIEGNPGRAARYLLAEGGGE
jgi:hypothetical protein